MSPVVIAKSNADHDALTSALAGAGILVTRRADSCVKWCQSRAAEGTPSLVACVPHVGDCSALDGGTCRVDGDLGISVFALVDADEARQDRLVAAGVRLVVPRARSSLLTAAVAAAVRASKRSVDTRAGLDTLLAYAPDPILIVSESGEIVGANALAAALFGYAESEFVGRSVEDLVPESRRAQHAARRASYASAPQVRAMGRGMQFPARHRDGSEFPVEISLAPIEVGGRRMVCCAVRDIRERVAASRVLRAIFAGTAGHTGAQFKRALVRHLAQALQVGVAFLLRFQRRGKPTLTAWCAGQLVSSEEDALIAGISDVDAVPPGGLVVAREARKRFPSAGLLATSDADALQVVRVTSADGDELLGYLGIAHAGALPDESATDQVLRLFANRAAAEIQRQRAEEDAREEAARLRLVTEHAPTMIAYCDPAGRYVFSNSRHNQFYGQEGVIEGRTMAEVLGPDVWHGIRRKVQRALGGDSVAYRVVRTVPSVGERTLDVDLRPHIDSAGEVAGLFVFVSDVTEDRMLADQLNSLNQELESRVQARTEELAKANSELSAFSYSISHDLRTPLRAMAGLAGLLEEDFGGLLPAEGRSYLSRITESAVTMGRLIDGLLEFARLGRVELRRKPVAVDAVVREVLADHVLEAERRAVDVRVGALPECIGDAVLLRQVFANLVGNAFKYTSTQPLPRIEIGARADGDFVTYFVRDNGAGFDPKYADKLFRVFQRLHVASEFEGEGIGLATVQRIVERHGGRVGAEGVPGEGATFYVSLPVA